MDLASLLGIGAGIGLLVWALFLGGSLGAFWNVPSLMITFGGTFAATLMSYPIGQVMSVMRVLRKAFTTRSMDPAEGIDVVVKLAQKARKNGILSLEDDAQGLEDDFLKRGLLLIIDGFEPATVRRMLETDMELVGLRHKIGQGLFRTMGSFSPSFGMIGTLIGLIQMLRNLSDAASVGPGMAVALVTTFYGALAANLLFLPIAQKLQVKSEQEMMLKEMLVEGLMAIQAGENPRLVEQRLRSYLPPNERNHAEGSVKVPEDRPLEAKTGQSAETGVA